MSNAKRPWDHGEVLIGRSDEDPRTQLTCAVYLSTDTFKLNEIGVDLLITCSKKIQHTQDSPPAQELRVDMRTNAPNVETTNEHATKKKAIGTDRWKMCAGVRCVAGCVSEVDSE